VTQAQGRLPFLILALSLFGFSASPMFGSPQKSEAKKPDPPTMAIILQAASAQTPQQPIIANLCEVVASPDRYNGKVLSVEGILSPGEHSVLLYSPSCKPKESLDVGIQAIFPPEWVASRNGKKLHKLFNHRTNASVKLIGMFESGTGRYGPDVARFRFTIREISSVQKRTLGPDEMG
jgi:hypothetical protein